MQFSRQAIIKRARKQLAAPTTTVAICLLGLLGGIVAALLTKVPILSVM
jgi:hypothetical protein